jgi:phosphohistidine phosphatase
MKTVFLIRHAKSSWKDSSLADIERPLNKRGFRDAPFMANLLRSSGVKPDRLISSPANRAYTTATYFAEAFAIPKPAIDIRKAIYMAYPEDILEMITGFSNSWNTVCLFGHNPTFTGVANVFTSDHIANVPTCGIVQIEATIDSWESFSPKTAQVAAFHFPKQYFSK